MSRQAVLAILERVASDIGFLSELAGRYSDALEGYELDLREAAVLANGDSPLMSPSEYCSSRGVFALVNSVSWGFTRV